MPFQYSGLHLMESEVNIEKLSTEGYIFLVLLIGINMY